MNISTFINNRNIRNSLLIVLLIFLFTLTADFGISYDEFWYRDVGFAVLNFLGESFFPEKIAEIKVSRNIDYFTLQKIIETAPIGFKLQHTIYGAIEYLFLDKSEKISVFLLRHYLNFTMSCLMFCTFYKILRLKFDKILSAIGLLMVILSPKIFSHYYFNPNDIWAFFSASLVVYFSLYFLKKNKVKYFYFLSFALAFSINTRLIFIYLYPVFLFFFFLKNKNFINISIYKKILFQFLLFAFFLYIITPELWISIFSIFNTFINQISFSADSFLHFNGEYIRSSQLPNYYTFVWILISTPTIYLIAFISGLVRYLINFKNNTLDLNFIFLFILIPIFAILVMKPNLFNGWRHFYFLNLGIIYFSVYGIEYFLRKIKKEKIKFFFIFGIFLYLLNISNWMIQNHPYQHVFFNYLSKAKYQKFDLDYWGLSNFEALNYIIDNLNLNQKIVKVKAIGESRIIYAYQILSKESQKKIKILKRNNILNADFYITNLHDGKNKDYYLSEGFIILKEIKVDNFAINLIMKKPN